jgi:hypothetical protein
MMNVAPPQIPYVIFVFKYLYAIIRNQVLTKAITFAIIKLHNQRDLSVLPHLKIIDTRTCIVTNAEIDPIAIAIIVVVI